MFKKVSVITPCYNGEKYLDRYFEGILSQTYKNLEVILIDDGSVDKTRQKCDKFLERLSTSGIEFKYIYKRNGGVNSAINVGLKMFTGDYITWPDCDDWLIPNSIEEKVRFLEDNPSYNVVRTDGYFVPEGGDFSLKQKFSDFFLLNKDMIFDDLVFCRTYFAPIGYLFRRKVIKECIPDLQINEKYKRGQNCQLLLPICFKHRVGYINKPLFAYLVRKDSLSHRSNYQGFNKKIDSINTLEDIFLYVLKNIKNLNLSELISKLKMKNEYQRFFTYMQYHKSLNLDLDVNNIFSKERLIIWGTGKASIQILDVLKEMSLFEKIVYFIDNDPIKQGQFIDRFPIRGMEDLLKEKNKNYLILVASSYYQLIREQLLDNGLLEFHDFINGIDIIK